jgi:hypothetical protein
MRANLAPQPCIRLDPHGPDREAAMRFRCEAPRQRAHSHHGDRARQLLGLPPPRIVISVALCERNRMLKFCLCSSVITLRPAA